MKSRFGGEVKELLLGHEEFEELWDIQADPAGGWTGRVVRGSREGPGRGIDAGASRGHRQRVKLWECADHPGRVLGWEEKRAT